MFTPVQTQGAGGQPREMVSPTTTVSPLSSADLLRPEALPGAKPQAQGLRAGSFLLYPDISVAEYVAIMTNTLLADVKAKLPAGLQVETLLAAAADKTSTITVDTLVYLNSILGINTVTNGVTTAYYDFSTVNYDRAATRDGKTAEVLVLQPDGLTYVKTTVNLYDAVFNSTNWVDTTPTGGADDFAVATDDALRVIQFIHDNAVR